MTLQIRMTEIADCDRGTDDDGNYTDTGYTWDVIDMDDNDNLIASCETEEEAMRIYNGMLS